MTGLLQHIAFISMPGGGEWMVILVIGLLIFGRRLPDVARSLGKSVNEFKKGMREFQDSADEVVRDVNKATSEAASDAKDASGMNDYGYCEPETATSSGSGYESPESAASEADRQGAPESTDVASTTTEGGTPDEVAEADVKEDEHNPYVEPMK